MLFNPGAKSLAALPEALAKAKTLLVRPTGLLRHLRIAGTQHPLLQCCVKPACSQVQMTLSSYDIFSKWSGRQDCFAISALPGRNIRCCNATLNQLVRRFKYSVVVRHFFQNVRADRFAISALRGTQHPLLQCCLTSFSQAQLLCRRNDILLKMVVPTDL